MRVEVQIGTIAVEGSADALTQEALRHAVATALARQFAAAPELGGLAYVPTSLASAPTAVGSEVAARIYAEVDR